MNKPEICGCPECRVQYDLREAAQALADARVARATAFLRFRAIAKTDNAAQAMATVEMNGEVEKAEAEYEIAKAALAREGR